MNRTPEWDELNAGEVSVELCCNPQAANRVESDKDFWYDTLDSLVVLRED